MVGMLKKLTVFLVGVVIVGLIATTINGGTMFKATKWHFGKETEPGIMTGVDGKVFDQEIAITNEQMLVVFSRLMGDIPKEIEGDKEKVIEYSKKVAADYGVMLPSDLVYSRKDWEGVWKELLVGQTLFEKIEEDKYSVTLIPGYFRIYLNEQGYVLFKKGIVPPHITFYSPFTKIEDLTDETLSKPATKGFILELMSIYDIYTNDTDYSAVLKERPLMMHKLTDMVVQETLKKSKKEWDNLDINRYNYIGLSYCGAMQYGILRGYVDSSTTIEDMNRPVKGLEVAVLINKIMEDKGLPLDSIDTLIKTN